MPVMMLDRIRRRRVKAVTVEATDGGEVSNSGHDPGFLNPKRLRIWRSQARVIHGQGTCRQPLEVDDIIASTVSVLSAVRDCSDAMPPLKSVVSAAVMLLDLVRVRHCLS